MSRRLPLTPLIIFFVALTVRVIYLYEIESSPFFDSPVIDAMGFDDSAVDIVSGDFWGKGVFWQAPFYQYFLAGVYFLFGHDYVIARFTQFVLGSLSCVLAYLIGRRVFGFAVGVLAGLFSAFYGVSVFFEGELLRPALFIFLSLLSVHLLYVARQRGGEGFWFVPGLVLGLAAATRPTIFFFFPLVFAWIFFSFRERSLSDKSFMCIVLLLGAACPILPVSVRNFAVGKEFFLVSSNFGVNFYLGNNPRMEETVNVRPWRAWDRLMLEPINAGFYSRKEQSGYWFGESLEYIKSEPFDYVKLIMKKTYLFLNSYEIKRNQDPYFLSRYSRLLSILLWRTSVLNYPFGLFGPLAFVGMIISLREWRKVLLLYMYCLSVTASTVLFFVCSRYRLPAVPVMLIFSGYAIVWWARILRSGEYKQAVYSLIAFTLFFVLVNSGWGMKAWNRIDYSDAHLQQGMAYGRKGMLEESVSEYLKAVDYDGNNVDAHMELGLIYAESGQKEKAVHELETVLKLDPGYERAENELGELEEIDRASE